MSLPHSSLVFLQGVSVSLPGLESTSSKVILSVTLLSPVITKLAPWHAGKQQNWAEPRHIRSFTWEEHLTSLLLCFGRADNKCSLFFFFISTCTTSHHRCAPWYLFGDQEGVHDNSKGSSSTGDRQGHHYLCRNYSDSCYTTKVPCLSLPQVGGLLPFQKLNSCPWACSWGIQS